MTSSSPNDAAEAFSLYAEDYDRWFDEPKGRILFELEIKAIRLLMKDLMPPFLEIGVGSGRFAVALGIQYGIEPADALLRMAQERGIHAERSFGEKLPYPDAFFEGVFILCTLCFVKEPGKVIEEAKRVLKHDGALIIGIINKESKWGKLYQKKKAEGHPIYKYAHFYSIDEVETLIRDSRLIVEAYSSSLCQPTSDIPHAETVHNRLVENAGFVCIRARKTDS